MSKAMSLKAKIRNIAKQKNIPAQVILQNYMFERLLVRLSASEYKEKFVLKGGMLVAAIVGLDNRATMDMDTTLKICLLLRKQFAVRWKMFATSDLTMVLCSRLEQFHLSAKMIFMAATASC